MCFVLPLPARLPVFAHSDPCIYPAVCFLLTISAHRASISPLRPDLPVTPVACPCLPSSILLHARHGISPSVRFLRIAAISRLLAQQHAPTALALLCNAPLDTTPNSLLSALLTFDLPPPISDECLALLSSVLFASLLVHTKRAMPPMPRPFFVSPHRPLSIAS
jgi:hypothetical protein